MSAIEGDFIGFTFGGTTSQSLGIMRVSNGSRYTETLLPEFSNKTMNVPGSNRTDYLGMEYTQKSFPLDIAFDSVTEGQLRDMKKLFSTQVPLPLIFDETPYKTYYVKAGNPPSISYICFEENGQRVYKGEGKIDLVSYFPYGFCNPRELDDAFDKANCNEWLVASGLQTIQESGLGASQVCNPGDFETPFWVKINVGTGEYKLVAGKIELDNNNTLSWTSGTISNDGLPADAYIIIDGRNHLIEGYDANDKKTGRIYNQFISSGDWFNIPINSTIKSVTIPNNSTLEYRILYI